MEQGNIYIQARMTSQNNDQPPIHINKMGVFDYRGRLQLYVKEALQFVHYVPFGNFWLKMISGQQNPLNQQQQISITLAEDFDNTQFGHLQTIVLAMENK